MEIPFYGRIQRTWAGFPFAVGVRRGERRNRAAPLSSAPKTFFSVASGVSLHYIPLSLPLIPRGSVPSGGTSEGAEGVHDFSPGAGALPEESLRIHTAQIKRLIVTTHQQPEVP